MTSCSSTLLAHLPIVLVVLLAGAATPPSQANDTAGHVEVMPPYIRLYEGNGLSQNAVCSIQLTPGTNWQLNFKGHDGGCANDEARSIEFERMPAGTIVELYDEPSCGKNDDWVSFTFKKLVPRTWAWGFQYDLEDTEYGDGDVVYSKVYHGHNGLDGKVSCMIISVAPEH